MRMLTRKKMLTVIYQYFRRILWYFMFLLFGGLHPIRCLACLHIAPSLLTSHIRARRQMKGSEGQRTSTTSNIAMVKQKCGSKLFAVSSGKLTLENQHMLYWLIRYIFTYVVIYIYSIYKWSGSIAMLTLPDGTFCYLSVSSSQWKWLEFMDLVKETSQWPAWKSYKIMKTEAIWRYPWPPYFRHIFGWFWTVQWWFWMTSKRALSQLFQARVFEPKHVGRISSLTHVWSYKFSYWHKIHKSQTLPNSVDCSSCFLSNSMHICTMQCPQPGTFPRNQIQVLVLNSTRNSSSACLKAK